MLKKKIDYGGIKMGKRNNQEKRFMKQVKGVIKDNRENELEDGESEPDKIEQHEEEEEEEDEPEIV